MYQVLARKYRPRNFIELVGQNHVSRALTSALERGRLHHAYLFTGTRGVGKTTIARILAKCLNCETGVTSTPCEVCATCTAVNEGRFIDLIEIDAASRTKVEDTRELLDNVPYAPTQGRFKVYLIDEVHMLSTHSFNALLKTLEEPPEHVKFLFATTDPQKLPITVISRCLQFTLRPLAVDEITTHLTDILNKEHIQAEQDAIWQIAESAQGSLRDALSLTDQAIAYGQGAIQHQDVKEMLGLIDRTIIFDLILAIHQNQQQHVSALLMQFRQQALDVSLVLDQFISTLHELALLQYLPNLSLKYSAEINQKIMRLSGLISAQDLQLYYQVACKGRADLQLAVTQEQGFEMCVLRLLAFRPLQHSEVTVLSTAAATNAPIQNTVIQSPVNHDIADAHTSPQTPQSLEFVSESNEIQTEPQQHPQVLNESESLPHSDTEDDYLWDDEEQHQNDDAKSHGSIENEPSSDDFLDDELEPQAVAQQISSSELSVDLALIETVEQQDFASVVEASAVELQPTHVDVIAEEPALSLFGEAPISPVQQQVSTAQAEDIFFLDPSENGAVSTNSVIEPDQSKFEAESHQSVAAQTKTSIAVQTIDSALMPQDILKLIPQELDGDWTLDKWEFWFRHSELTPAVQELAQQGVMTGQIGGESIFNIPQKYEQLLTQFLPAMEELLKSQWSNTRLSVKYQEVTGATPFDNQDERKARAYQRAEDLLNQESVVKGLIERFDGQLQNIQLKP